MSRQTGESQSALIREAIDALIAQPSRAARVPDYPFGRGRVDSPRGRRSVPTRFANPPYAPDAPRWPSHLRDPDAQAISDVGLDGSRRLVVLACAAGHHSQDNKEAM